MKEYLISIISISIIVGICEIIVPKHHGIDKYTKMVGVLCVICVIAAPIKKIINDTNENWLDDIKENILSDESEMDEEYNDIMINYLSKFSSEELVTKIKELLFENFQIPVDNSEIIIETTVEKDKIKIKHVQILLINESIFKNPYKIEEYFSNLLNCRCEVLIKGV